MPETPAVPSLTPTPDGSSTPPGLSAAPPALPAPPSLTEFRFPDSAEIEPWARGKTAAEVLAIGKTMNTVLEKFNQQGAVQHPAQPQYQSQPQYQQPQYGYQQPPPPVETLGDDEFLTGRQVKLFGQQLAQSMAPQFQQAVNLAAQTAVGVAQTRYADEFKRWGPEINALVANMPRETLSLDNIGLVVDVVRGRHYRELVDDAARQRAAEMVPSLRPNGGATEPPGPSGLDAQVPPDWSAKARSVGLGDAEIREFCAANNMPVETFYKQFEGGLITAAVAESRPRPVVR